MVWQAAAIGAGSQLLGGLLQKPKKLQQNFKEERQNLRNIVRGAQEAGFNPLTVLRATGGQPTANAIQSPLGARAALGEAIKTFGGTYAQDAIQRATEDRAQEDWKERYDYQLQNPLSPVRQTTRTTQNTETKDDGFLKEGQSLRRGADYPMRDHRIQVRLPSGQNVWMPAEWGERFTIQEGGLLTAGDVTEMVGEFTGEVANTLSFDKILENAFRTGLFLNDEEAGGALDLNPNRNKPKRSGGL